MISMNKKAGELCRRLCTVVVGFSLVISGVLPLIQDSPVHAASLTSETFAGISTPEGAWISGGSGGSVACLTAASVSATGSIPRCSASPIDAPGSGVLRLTPNAGDRSGFAIYNTPVSAENGLNIAFDMYQYNGTGADGISFFLIDGNESPTQPGAAGGALGYASDTGGENPGIVGGYVGVGFDKFGNFSSPQVGAGGPGSLGNSIAVRGSEATNYQFVTRTPADGQLANNGTSARSNARRHVVIFVSTNNIMTVSVDYNDGQGLRTELSNIDLNTINGEGSLPETFKLGFAASTGGSNNIHEISGLTVNTLNPNVSIDISRGGTFIQGGTSAYYDLTVSNNAGAEATSGTVTVSGSVPGFLTPTSASGTGWECGVESQDVTCTRSDVLQPGESFPAIRINVQIADNAPNSVILSASVAIAENDNSSPIDSEITSIANGSSEDSDGIFNTEEDGGPNNGDANDDGVQDAAQSSVTSFLNAVTGNYAVLESEVCEGNTNVGAASESDQEDLDGGYSYPVGLMNFSLICDDPGDEATVTHYYYGSYNASELVARKYYENTGTYATIDGAVLSNVNMDGGAALKIVYQIKDGGPYDQDGSENGTIVDPAGPALLAAVPTPTPSPSPSAEVVLTSSATPTPAGGIPRTGLPVKSWGVPVASLVFGLGLLGFELYKYYRSKKLAK